MASYSHYFEEDFTFSKPFFRMSIPMLCTYLPMGMKKFFFSVNVEYEIQIHTSFGEKCVPTTYL